MLLHEMKGVATTVMVGHSATRGWVELARFADGSWAIRQGGPTTTIGVWEPEERVECFRVFGMLAGVRVPAALWPEATAPEDAAAGGTWN
jgi:hypothetical protein